MIGEYHRPQELHEALKLITRTTPVTVPLGGGTYLSRHQKGDLAVVDLQALGLNRMEREGQYLRIGAACTLQQLHNHPEISPALREAIYRERSANLRRMATVAGVLVTCDGRSTFAAALLALDARLVVQPGDESISLGDWLPLRSDAVAKRLITEIVIPLNAGLQFETVARTPQDRPIVIVARATWPSGRNRIAVGGYANSPRLALDGPEPSGIEDAVRNAFIGASDLWASEQYRQEAAAAIIRRLTDAV